MQYDDPDQMEIAEEYERNKELKQLEEADDGHDNMW